MNLESLLLPYLWENMERAHSTINPNLRVKINPENLGSKIMHVYDFLPQKTSPKLHMDYYRPWGELLRKSEGGASTVTADKNQFRVDLDVQQFSPEEINVKVVDRFVIVEAKHEEKEDEHGWISRQFMRKYIIPEQCDIDQASSKLSSDGVLSIIVPRKQKVISEGERVINIEHTGKPCDAQNEERKEKEEDVE